MLHPTPLSPLYGARATAAPSRYMSAWRRQAMIEFRINDRRGQLEVGQQDVSPTVYLDHWALRSFSDNESLATRLTAALELGNGTLALSWLNLVEFTKVTVEQQARNAEDLLEANLPRVFFLEVEPFSVIRREDELVAGRPPAPPHADLGFLSAFSCLRPTSLNSFTAHDLFQVVQASQLANSFDDLADTVVRRVAALRDELDTNPGFQSAVRRLPCGPRIQRGTRFLLREMLRTLLVDKGTRITRNHAIDLMHAVVPVSYCDFVLLDKHWETQVDRVRSRLKMAGMTVPMGKVFSGKANGVDRFLRELESS